MLNGPNFECYQEYKRFGLKLKSVLCLIYLLAFSVLYGQREEVMTNVSEQLEHLVRAFTKQGNVKPTFRPYDMAKLDLIFGPKLVDSLQLFADEQYRLAEMAEIRNDKGLAFTSSYTNNLQGTLLEEEGALYQWRVGAGITWRLVRDGVLAKKHLFEQKKLHNEAEMALISERFNELSYRKSFDFIIYSFNQLKVELINERLGLLENMLDVVEKMYYLRYFTWEDVLEVMSHRSETALLLENYREYIATIKIDSTLRDINFDDLPVFDLSFDHIKLRGVDLTSRTIALDRKVEALDHSYHWSKDIGLNLQMRYNLYNGGAITSYGRRDFVSGGLTLTCPLPFDQSSKRAVKEAQVEKLRLDFNIHQDNLYNELITQYYEFQYAHKQYIAFYHKRQRISTDVERELIKKNLADPDYSPMQVVKRLDELLSVDLELIDIKQKMYLKALKVFHTASIKKVEPYIRWIDYYKKTSKYPTKKFILVASNTLLDLDHDFLVEYLHHNDIDEAIVGPIEDADTYLAYTLLTAREDISVRTSIHWSADKSLNDVAHEINMSKTQNIHINFIKHEELGHFLDSTVLAFFDSISLVRDIHVSLPIITSKSVIQILNSVTTSIYLVPEESYELASMYYKKAQHLPGHFELMVNPDDFRTRFEFDKFIRELGLHLDLERIGVLDLESMLRLEKQLVGRNEEHRF